MTHHLCFSVKQHVPLKDYKELLLATVRHLQAGGTRAVVIITPPPIDEAARRTARMQVEFHLLLVSHRIE